MSFESFARDARVSLVGGAPWKAKGPGDEPGRGPGPHMKPENRLPPEVYSELAFFSLMISRPMTTEGSTSDSLCRKVANHPRAQQDLE